MIESTDRSSLRRRALFVIAPILAVVTIYSLSFGATWIGIEWQGFFGPKRAAVERNIFEQTKSFRHGKIQDLSRYRMQYLTATTDDERAAITSTVRFQFAAFDAESLDQPKLQQFMAQCLTPNERKDQ